MTHLTGHEREREREELSVLFNNMQVLGLALQMWENWEAAQPDQMDRAFCLGCLAQCARGRERAGERERERERELKLRTPRLAGDAQCTAGAAQICLATRGSSIEGGSKH